jgi:hypothetical protein
MTTDDRGPVKPFARPWKLVEVGESFQVQDAAGVTLAMSISRTSQRDDALPAVYPRTMRGGWRSRSCGCRSLSGSPVSFLFSPQLDLHAQGNCSILIEIVGEMAAVVRVA